MLSIKDGDLLKSYLFIAITDDDLRGKYICTLSDEPDVALQTFIIGSKTVNPFFLLVDSSIHLKFSGSVFI